ncbi:X-linked retinitis pigmentosa GTPase regulator-interacting protein 1 isoform X5 [Silurus meridionalis]|uniref:X-linked retinitis pigmentosa GTPase regulator-interacting protein 1 isoform X5 n=1 Tax=Silurus meridionalis TaxID=175797 RepID=UPI001EEAF9E5|nr:X-linked retinitis pigmentosa GTPase regulator-interacting protein 1 isoform X5 [Silurus meridionalis]
MAAIDIPVRDVGLKGASMPVIQGQDVWSSKILPKVLKSHVSWKQLEDQYLCLQKETTLLKQHVHIIEQNLQRFFSKLSKMRNGNSCFAWGQHFDAHDPIGKLKNRVPTLEIPRIRRGVQREGEVTQTTQTAPVLSFTDDYKDQNERLKTVELAIQSISETFKFKEKGPEDPMEEMHKQQVDLLRLTIKDNVDVIRLKKQLSTERTALLVIKDKFTDLKQAYETQLEESQRSLQENQETLLGKVGQLNELLKEEKQRALDLEGQLNSATIALHSLAELQERVLHIEGERNLLKKSYNALLLSTLSAHSHHNEHENEKDIDSQEVEPWRADMLELEKKLENEKREREKLEQENKRVMQENDRIQVERAEERAMTSTLIEKHAFLEQEALQYRQNVKSLQERLDRESKDFHIDVEDLSEVLMQIKAFRLQHESFKRLTVLESNEKVKDPSQELAALQASHAETILELQKTRELLALQHRLNIDLQTEMKIEKERAEREREWNRREVNEKDKLLKNRSLHINSLKAQLKHLTYHPRNYNQIISQQNTWRGMEKGLPQMKEGNTMLNQLQDGESLLEINLMGATFTPMGLRLMREQRVVDASGPDLVTFCTYTVLDFEMHSTPLVSGTQPNYGFTSCFVLTENSRTMLETQEVFAHIEVHQSLGGIQFITQGRSSIPLRQAILHKGEKVKGRVNITGSKGEIIGVLEFWVRLFFEEEPKDIHTDSHTAFYWSHTQPEALQQEDYEKVKEESPSVQLQNQMDSEVLKSLESLTTSDSDVIISQPQKPIKEGYRLKVEILSLLFDPASSVALDQSVQQVYVEYRLFGIPTETTETPTSLQKPTEGEEIHFNFSRIIHIDSIEAVNLKQYLYTILERSDADQSRLKFTVVSEPLNEEEECVDVGHACLDLQELLLTGNDVTECQINIVRMDRDQEVVGRLRVSLEAAQTLKGISC